jgi:glycosyltransferase involved in cell wall biosynthesis
MEVLFIDSRYPLIGCGVLNGSRQRSILLSRAVSEFAAVDLLVVRPRGREADAPDGLPSDVSPFRRTDELHYERRDRLWSDCLPAAISERLRLLRNPHRHALAADPAISAWLREAVERRRYDAIVCRYLGNAAKSGALDAGAPVVLDVDDVDYEHAKNDVEMPYHSRATRFLLRRHLPSLGRAAGELYGRCRRLFVCKEADRDHPGLEDATVLPNIPFHLLDGPSPRLPESRGEKRVVFVGDLEWGPSTAAAAELVAVWPAVVGAVPGARLRLVGRCRALAEADAWRAVPGVELPGYVASIRDEYERATLFAAPIRHGSGTNIKVLEAASYGRTGVVSRFALRGAEEALRHRKDVLVAESRQELRDSIVELISDAELRRQLSANAWAAIQRRYSFEALAGTVSRTLRDAVG